MNKLPPRSVQRVRLMVGVSASAMLSCAAQPGFAADGGMFSRVTNPAIQAAQASSSQAQQNAAASAATQQALAAFTQAAATRSALDASQVAARAAAAAMASSVPNGLGKGGLDGDSSLWTNASAPTQTTGSDGRTKVDIDQTGAQAILDWQTFNIGQKTDLTFNQSSSTWVALNRISDPNANPTQILGTISAPGTILIMNANGVIFGGASQVNVGSLIAAAGTMTDGQFLANGIYSAQSGTTYLPSITGALGAVQVQAGAQLTTNAPASGLEGGGYVMLLGGAVANDGSITTPMGQTILAAGDSFLIRPGYGTTANTASTTRGSEIAPVIAATSSNGTVTNSGEIYAQQGDITLAGRDITQAGVLLSTSSVNQRGTIHLLNSASDTQGQIILTANSLTTVMPELDSDATALESERDALIAASGYNGLATGQFDDLSTIADRKDQSRIEIVSGGSVDFQGASQTIAQGGQIAVDATGRILAEDGAWLDVSGVQDVALDVSTNNILINVQGNELRDSSVNRDDPDKTLYSSADGGVWVDARDLVLVPAGTGGDTADRYYTAGGLLEVSGYLGTVPHTIGEWDSIGGTITLKSNEVVAQNGSTFNIAGGSINYASGYVMQTLLEGADGKIYTADTAPADIDIVSIGLSDQVEHVRWGDQYTETYQNAFTQTNVAVYENGYTVGKDAGQLVISAPTVVFEGTIDAEVIQGTTQTAERPVGVTDGFQLPQDVAPLAGTLSIGEYDGTHNQLDTSVEIGDVASVGDGVTTTSALPDDRTGTVQLDAASLNSDGLGGLNVITSGSIAVDAPLVMANGGQVSMIAPTVSVNADITAHGGTVTLSDISHGTSGIGTLDSYFSVTPAGTIAQMTIAPDVTIDLTGLWSNAYTSSTGDGTGQAYVNGGNLYVNSTGAVTVGKGSLIDVSSGAAILIDGSMKGGTGGNVTLVADDYSKFNESIATYGALDTTEPLTLDGTIRAYGFNGGGTLTLGAGQPVVIGSDATLSGGTLAAGASTAVSTSLGANTTLPAGATIPIAYQIVDSATSVDTPLGAATTISLGTGVTTAAAWTVPAGVYVYAPTYYAAGTVVPAGAKITTIATLPVGTVVPSSVFPNGLPITPVVVASYTAGETLTAPVTLPKGTVIPAGTSFGQDVAIAPTLTLDPGLFQSGFSNYVVSSSGSVEVSAGTKIDVTVPVYAFNATSLQTPSGADPASAATLWTPPTYTESPQTSQLITRTGANLTLSAVGDFAMGAGSSITVDPEHSVSIFNNGQTTIDGAITAHGGAITIASLQGAAFNGGLGDFSLTRSLWIGGDATLDVSGIATTAVDQRGLTYGDVLAGGSILLGSTGDTASATADTTVATQAFLVIRPGAVLDASGASATLAVAASDGKMVPTLVASDGGAIGLYSSSGIYNDGTMSAFAGGAGASGGSLTVELRDLEYNSNNPTATSPYNVGLIDPAMQVLHNVTITQAATPSGLSADAQAGKADPTLLFGQATVSADTVKADGFDALKLKSDDLFVFQGDVNLSLGRSLTLTNGIFSVSAATPDINVTLAAPYVSITGWAEHYNDGSYYAGFNTLTSTSLYPGDSSFTVDADLIDLAGDIRFGAHGHQGVGTLNGLSDPDPMTQDATNTSGGNIVDAAGFGQVTLDSTGDVRAGNGSLMSRGDVTIQAAQLYPMSGDSFALVVGVYAPFNTTGGIANLSAYDPDATLTLLGNGTTPDVPASVYGKIALVAPTIDQDGVLRAPLGTISFDALLTTPTRAIILPTNSLVDFGADSLTSSSANGLTMPYGGTVDDITYTGTIDTPTDLGTQVTGAGGGIDIVTGISVSSTQMVGEKGAVLDVSGGGNLTGAGFITGRGGSVDVLTGPLVNSNPYYGSYSSASDQVYAIVPGYASDYAPVIGTNGAGDPAIGQQVTIGAGVPGLAAGTYTLLPSSYALLPGAFRVELGATGAGVSGVTTLPNGSVLAAGKLGIANTGIESALSTTLILSSAATVRTYSQYDETSYADFETAQAATFDNVRPRIAADAGIIQLDLGAPTDGSTSLSYAGTALMNGADDGVAGTLLIGSSAGNALNGVFPTIDITAPGATPIAGHTSISTDNLAAFAGGSIDVGGYTSYLSAGSSSGAGARVYFNGNLTVNVLDGADLTAGQVFLVGSNVTVADGATISTVGQGSTGLDSSAGYVFANAPADNYGGGPAVVAVANGYLDFLPASGSGTVTIATGATLLSDGTIALAGNGGLTMGDVTLGAKYLEVTQQAVNIGSADALAAATAAGVLPAGWNLTQATLDMLLKGADGAPALEQLSVTAGGSVNLFGTVTLDATTAAGDVAFVLNTPAIYGLGGAGDTATISADTFYWNGIRTGGGSSGGIAIPYGSGTPAAILAGGAGTGTGTLDIDAKTIVFGYDPNSRPTDGASLVKVATGFGTVNIDATDAISSTDDGSLTVAGDLNLTTPVIESSNGSTVSFTATGALTATAPAGSSFDTSTVSNLGGSVTLTGASVLFDTAAALPSGALTLSATNDVTLGDNAKIDLAGRTVAYYDQDAYSWGGNLTLSSDAGNITQAAGSTIDMSAAHNDAGTLTVTALGADAGRVSLNGTLLASAGDGFTGGSSIISAQLLGADAGTLSTDFAALNTKLDTAGFTNTRDFDLRQGDLVIGDEVKAHDVEISLDGGSLTVNGTIDASGSAPGTIYLAAMNDLTPASTAVLDTHGTVLQTDSYGAAVDADNTAHVTLSSTDGTVTLGSGATIDMSAADGVARGQLEIYAPRLGSTGASATGAGAPANATGGDVAVSAGGKLTIKGAASIAVYGVASYANAPTDPNTPNGQLVDQDWLDLVNQDSQAFIDGAYGDNVAGGVLSSALAAKLGGLTAYGDAFHLRPGVEVVSATPGGTLSTSGDLDLATYRYGPGVNPAVEGSGEPGSLTLRAGGNLLVNGSISDGFAPAPASPDAVEVLYSNDFLYSDYTVTVPGTTIGAGSTFYAALGAFPIDLTYSADTATGEIVTTPTSGSPLPVSITLAKTFKVAAAGRIVYGTIYNPDGSVRYSSGQALTSGDVFPIGTTLSAGTYFSSTIVNGTYPLWYEPVVLPAGANPVLFGDYIYKEATPVPVGTVIPAYLFITTLSAASGQQIDPLAPMLAPGTQSWSMNLVAGADLASADVHTLQTAKALNGSGNVVLDDPYTVGGLSTYGYASPGFAVVRTGTGDLTILAGGNYDQQTAYGVYTAGTAVAVDASYEPDRATFSDGTVLGAGNDAYEATLGPDYMYYTTNGGDFTLKAQGNISGTLLENTTNTGQWLWREGGTSADQPVAWGINFGSYVVENVPTSMGYDLISVGLSGFSGMGTLGGGNVTLSAGGDIGDAGRGIAVAVGGSGRVLADGSLVQTGGGTLAVTAGGIVGAGGNSFTNVRGDTDIDASAFGTMSATDFGYDGGTDPRPLSGLASYGATTVAGGSVNLGDSDLTIQTRSVLALGTVGDPGRTTSVQNPGVAGAGAGAQGLTSFTLWQPDTAITLFSAGGDVSPLSTSQAVGSGLPPILTAIAAQGSIFLTPSNNASGSYMMPSVDGALTLLAEDSVIGPNNSASAWGPLATAPSSVATPLHPAWESEQVADANDFTVTGSNYWSNPAVAQDSATIIGPSALFDLGANTVTDASAASAGAVSRIYAVNGDISDLVLGTVITGSAYVNGATVTHTYYQAVKPLEMMAGGDIVNVGGLLLNQNDTDIDTIAASGNIIFAKYDVAGPGELELIAGKNIYQGSTGTIESLGPIETGDTRDGASVVLQAGAGAGTPGIGQVDWTGFAALYLDPANQLAAGAPLDTSTGKVAQTYQAQLLTWLQDRFGYTGTQDGAYAYFVALPAAQQRVFLRTVYNEELTAAGREYNDPDSSRFGSYFRGREAIATLFPGAAGSYAGDITMFTTTLYGAVSSGYVHTDFGGDIDLMAPGGAVTVGSAGIVPGAAAGLITQGSGDIDIYADQSVLLGLSRIMTTYGGDILIWSADGDINAGRGSKTTVVFTPPKTVYDDYGDITLAPQVPSTGAGIATLAPIPEVPAGDVDLIAPLGTVDAGEAGIRVSGNVNIAALHVVNAANIAVKGTASGLPTTVAVNTGALTSASNAASAVASEAEQLAARAMPTTAPPEMPMILTVRFMGFGDE